MSPDFFVTYLPDRSGIHPIFLTNFATVALSEKIHNT